MTKKVEFLRYNRSGARLNPMGVVVHETATPGATARDEFNFFNTGNRDASAHGFVDWNEYIQTVPYTEIAWHAGQTANRRYIGIELCHAETQEEFIKVWDNAALVIASIFSYFGWEVTKDTLLSHSDVSLRWGETDHTDPIGYFKKFGKTMEDFKDAVKNEIIGGLNMTQYEELKSIISKQAAEIEGMKAKLDKVDTYIYNYIDDNMPKWAKPTIKKLVDKGALVGDDNGLNLNKIMMRILVILDRIGIFGG